MAYSMITPNEKKVLRYLLAYHNVNSINQIARSCQLSPNGAHKIFRKFEKEGMVTGSKIANLISYKINFKSREAKKILEFILLPTKDKKIQFRYHDLAPLEKVTSLCILFGSYITTKEKPNDLDVLFVVEKKKYAAYHQLLEKVKLIVPLKIHDVVQTSLDLQKNIRVKEPFIVDILHKGIVLWGQESLI